MVGSVVHVCFSVRVGYIPDWHATERMKIIIFNNSNNNNNIFFKSHVLGIIRYLDVN